MLTRVVDPVGDFVSLDEMKDHLRIPREISDHDSRIAALIEAAVAHLDGPRGVLGRCIQPQTWRIELDDGIIKEPWYCLPLPNAKDVRGWGLAGANDPVELRIRRQGLLTYVGADPAVRAIEFVAETPRDCWPSIAHAIKLTVAHWFEHTEAVSGDRSLEILPIGVARLLSPLKLRWV